MKKKFKMFHLILLILAVLIIVSFYFLIGNSKQADKIIWGVDFSQMQTEILGLNWKEAYLKIIDELGVKNIKIHTQWDWVEGDKDNYFFDDIDWQIKKAEEKSVKIIYVVGVKTGRWPECHMPEWLGNLSKEDQQNKILEYVKRVVLRYKNSKAIEYWQVENEPFFNFGQCPEWYYKDKQFLQKEVDLVKSLDPDRKIIISDSGEQSLWLKPAKMGDIVGITMYRKVWHKITDNIGFNLTFIYTPMSYYRKYQIIKKIYNKEVFCVELQAEPWTKIPYIDATIETQLKTMNLNQFKKNVEYAKATGLNRFYFWGAEWWYWMKENQGKPEIWNEAKKIFMENK